MKLSNFGCNRSNSVTKNVADVALRLSLIMIGAKETSFRHNFLLTDRQFSISCRAVSKNLLIKVMKNQIIQSGGFLARFLGPSFLGPMWVCH